MSIIRSSACYYICIVYNYALKFCNITLAYQSNFMCLRYGYAVFISCCWDNIKVYIVAWSSRTYRNADFYWTYSWLRTNLYSCCWVFSLNIQLNCLCAVCNFNFMWITVTWCICIIFSNAFFWCASLCNNCLNCRIAWNLIQPQWI